MVKATEEIEVDAEHHAIPDKEGDAETDSHSDYEERLMVEFTSSSEDEDNVDASMVKLPKIYARTKSNDDDEESSAGNEKLKLDNLDMVKEKKGKKRKLEKDSSKDGSKSKSKKKGGKSKTKVVNDEPIKLECETCGKIFPRKFGLERHEKIHTNERPYKCDSCDKSFTQKAHLQKHKRTHDKSKDNPGKGSGSKNNSGNSDGTEDNTEKSSSYKCNECGKEFNGKYYLNRHEKIHTDERDHKCEICEKAFRQASHLKKHMNKVHCVDDSVTEDDTELSISE